MTRFGSLELPEVPKALRAGYGASDRLKHNNTVKSMTSPGDRPQQIYTPEPIVEAILHVWGRVALDPCWGPGSIVPSEEHCYVPPRIELKLVKNKETGKFVEKPRIVYKAAPGDQDGLEVAWKDYTFANYPYEHANLWLPKCVAEAERGLEIMNLGPVRPHRKWWRAASRTATAQCYLNPVKFLGYKSAHTIPLSIMYWGDTPALFKYAFESRGLGECL